MNTEVVTIFTDETTEFNALQAANPTIDLTDWSLPSTIIPTFTQSPDFLISAPVYGGFLDLEFNLANNFWGCNFNFGNAACGIQIRQGIAHMIDRTQFSTTTPSSPINSPEPVNNGGLLSPNPCAWDASFLQTGTGCIVGAAGGAAYLLHPATGANGINWLQAAGSSDLNAAAYHIVTALSSLPGQSSVGCDGATGASSCLTSADSRITGVNTAATNYVTPNFFIRTDNPDMMRLGTGLNWEICYLFTGSYNTFCSPYLKDTPGPGNSFTGFTFSPNQLNLNWWTYTLGLGWQGGLDAFEPGHDAWWYHDPWDTSLYYLFNSRGVSGFPSIQLPTGTCSAQSVNIALAADYTYLCSVAYDGLSSQVENSPCLTAQGDPVQGAASNLPTSPGNGLCPGTSLLSSYSAGIQAEDLFGQKEFTVPIISPVNQYGYLNNWSRVINSSGGGTPNYFTWLNAYNPSANVAWTIRQGMVPGTSSVNPYIASTTGDLMIMGNVYDTLYAINPLSDGQLINWMTISTFQKDNASLGYPAPAHTQTTYRFTLRPDLYFQDGRQVTSYDVAFSYLSMQGSGAIFGAGANSMTGITVLQPHQFDISVNSPGVYVLPDITGVPIVSGRYWTNLGFNSWDTGVTACTTGAGCGKSQYALSGPNPLCNTNAPFSCTAFPASLMTVNPNDLAATFDPVANHIMIGSGPWTCGSVTGTGSGTGSGQCTPGGTMSTGSWTLTRFGAGVSACQQSNCYFRSSQNAALWIWSEQGGANSFLNFEAVASCMAQPVNLSGPCAHWQQGIGNPGSGSVVGLSQVGIANRFYALNWVASFDWATNAPIGIAPFPPILYEGTTTLSPASAVGCPTGYDC
jgi:hypothetical protein